MNIFIIILLDILVSLIVFGIGFYILFLKLKKTFDFSNSNKWNDFWSFSDTFNTFDDFTNSDDYVNEDNV